MSGEPIRYHFLFYFLAGNLEFLGLNLAWSVNILSILTLVCMLAVVMALGELLFKSRAVGYLAATFFFFHGTLNLVPFFRAQTSFKGALLAISKLGSYLSSGYPYRGEDWGIWTQVVFVNQRHFASSIGIFLVVLFFLFDRYLESAKQRKLDRALAAGVGPVPWQRTAEPSVAAGLRARHEEQATGVAPMDEAQPSAELQSAEQWSPEPETHSVGEAQPSGTVELPEESAQANYASAGETPVSDTVAHDEQSLPEPEVRSVGEVELSGTVEPLEESAQAANYASVGEGRTPETVAYDERSRSESETSAVGQAEPSNTAESLEGSSQPASYASVGEAPTFATRALRGIFASGIGPYLSERGTGVRGPGVCQTIISGE